MRKRTAPLISCSRWPAALGIALVFGLGGAGSFAQPASQPSSQPSPDSSTSAPAPLPPAAPTLSYDQRPEVQEFVDFMVAHHQMDRTVLMSEFARARYSGAAARLISPPPSVAPPLVWSEYRARFLDPVRIDAGVQFWIDHRDELARAELLYGVPAEVVVGILGVESLYGRNTGRIRVLDALATLAFDYPNKAHDRSTFFRTELEEFLVLARDNQLDANELRGSFAGAIGMPQFMPDSYRRDAVDFDGDGRIDLNDAVDSIGSVAHFLAVRGWQPGAPIYLRTQLVASAPDAQAIARLVNAGAEPSLSEADLRDAGFVVIDTLAPGQTVALVDLPDGDNGTRYVLGARNFFVVTRYNRSYPYAMAVLELGETVKAGVAAADALARSNGAPAVSVPSHETIKPAATPAQDPRPNRAVSPLASPSGTTAH